MKKLFICVMTSLCSTFAFADADLVVKPATISNGNGTMQVVINKAGQTAFQFDVKLPAGVSATAFSLTGAPESRQFEKAEYDKATNTWRFLSYDNGNATFDVGTTFNITLAAADGAEGGEAQSGGIVLVDPEGNGADVEGGNATVTVESTVSIPLSSIGSATFVCNKDLDFSSLTNVKAYICTGYDLSSDVIYFSRVNDVPANTPIYVKGPNNETITVPTGTSITYYGENFLIGEANSSVTSPAETDEYLCWGLGKTSGWIGVKTEKTWEAGKAYLKLPKQVSKSNVSGSNVDITMSKTGNLAYVGKYDLDFTGVDGLKAYIVMGFDKTGVMWISRVNTATAGTPLFLKGTNDKTYSVPSSQGYMVYKNMLRGDAENTSEVLKEFTKDGVDYVTWIYSKNGGAWGPLASDQSAFPAGTSYLPLLSAYAKENASSRGITSDLNIAVEREAEVLVMKLGSSNGEDDGTTGIRAIDEIQSDDAWYNLKGQRIDTPTKKGLYIKNGKKVVVK